MNSEENYSPIPFGQGYNRRIMDSDQNQQGSSQMDIYSYQFQDEQSPHLENIQYNHQGEDKIYNKEENLKSTSRLIKKMKNKQQNKNRSQNEQNGFEEGVDEQKETENSDEQIENENPGKTKNLTKYYIKHIIKEIKIMLQNEKNDEMEKQLKQMEDVKKYNCDELGKILDEQIIRKIAINYIKSFNFFSDLLDSKRQIHVGPIIQYAQMLEKMSYKEKIAFFKE